MSKLNVVWLATCLTCLVGLSQASAAPEPEESAKQADPATPVTTPPGTGTLPTTPIGTPPGTGTVPVVVATPSWSAVCDHALRLMGIGHSPTICNDMEIQISHVCGDATDETMRCMIAATSSSGVTDCTQDCAD